MTAVTERGQPDFTDRLAEQDAETAARAVSESPSAAVEASAAAEKLAAAAKPVESAQSAAKDKKSDVAKKDKKSDVAKKDKKSDVAKKDKKSDKDKKQLLLRLTPGLWEELAAWAEDDFRSVNGQIEFLLTECVRQRHKRSGKQE